MANDTAGQEIAPTQNRGVAAVFQRDLDEYTPNLMQALPAHVSVDKFKRVLITAVSSNPDLLYANRRTLFTASVRCASDGLLPDGREAALVVYNTKVKQRDPNTGLDREIRIDAVQYLPMIAGIRKRMRNTGDVLSADAHVVYEHDKFQFKLGDDGFISHEPAGLSTEQGKPLGAYAIIKLKSGEVLRDVMRASDIEKTRKQSRGANSLMWTTFTDEAWRKTVLKRCAKAAPQSAELDALLGRDEEEPPMMPQFDALPHHEPEPQRPAPEPIEHDDAPVYTVIDLDGVEHEFREAGNAVAALCTLLDGAAQISPDHLAGVWESNSNGSLPGFSDAQVATVMRHYADLTKHSPKPRRAPSAREAPPPASAAAPPAASPPTAPPERPADASIEERFMAEAAAQPMEIPADVAAAAHAAPLDAKIKTPPLATPPSDDSNLAIDPPMRRGQPDWRTWAIALFLPKVRQATDTAALAFLVGDNDANLTAARAALDKADREAMEAAISKRFGELDNAP